MSPKNLLLAVAALANAVALHAQTDDTAAPAADGAVEQPAAESQPAPAQPEAPPPLTAAQRAYVEQLLDEKLRALPPPQLPEMKLVWKGDSYTKFMFRNNQSNGCVTWGNPHPLGDNFAGENGICSELGLTLEGHVSKLVEVGARIQSRYGQEWADWWENGDRRTVMDTTGESLGMNHASYLQLRGVYVQAAPPIPTVRFVRIGQSDLSQYNAFTVGKVRYIDRFNAAGIFLNGDVWGYAGYELARVSLPKLWASANWNTGIDDPMIDNPFWTRDAAYVVKLTGSPLDLVDLRFVTSAILDEEADADDPDALGSTNQIDAKDGVVQTNFRYTNVDSTLEAEGTYFDFWHLKAIVGISYQKPDPGLVFNAVAGNQGLSPVVMKESWGYAAVARSELFDPFGIGLDLKLEYFNIGEDWTATMGARRESDVLLTDGFVDGGQLPTLNIANEFQDFTEPFYESIIGWHGVTALLGYSIWDLTSSLEATYIDYNTDRQNRNVDTVYPDFLFTDGQTDTDHYNFANTNDRGRDPRSVYHRNQARHTVIGALKAAYKFDLLGGVTLNGKGKYIWDVDQRDQDLGPDPTADDYTGHLFTGGIGISGVLTEHLTLGTGYQFDLWLEQHRSGDVVAGVADYPDYTTMKHKIYAQLGYSLEGLTFAYRIEYLDKNVTTSKPELDYHMRNIIRSVGSVSVSF